MSEHAAYNRIAAARAARRFPVILDLLADGSVHLTTVTILAPHLTAENHRAVLEEATHRSKEEVEVIKARLAPRPDVPATIRKLPAPRPVAAARSLVEAPPDDDAVATTGTAPPPVVPTPPSPRRAVVEPLAPERYRLQFTVGKETRDKLRRVQDLLAREIPDGDPAAIFDRALTLLLKEVESKKLGARREAAGSPGRRSPDRAMCRPTSVALSTVVTAAAARSSPRMDGGASARRYLEYHHIRPYSPDGEMSVENISLRCRAHNVYEAEAIFGRFDPSLVREAPADYVAFGNGNRFQNL